MTVVAFGIVVKSTTRSDDAAARTAQAFWASVAASHVHDFAETTMPGVRVCIACGRAMRRIPG